MIPIYIYKLLLFYAYSYLECARWGRSDANGIWLPRQCAHGNTSQTTRISSIGAENRKNIPALKQNCKDHDIVHIMGLQPGGHICLHELWRIMGRRKKEKKEYSTSRLC